MSAREAVSPFLGLQLPQVTISLAQHPNRERKLEVWIRNRDRPIEYPLDRFLRPRTVLRRETKCECELQMTRPKGCRERTGSCLDMTSLTARSIGSG